MTWWTTKTKFFKFTIAILLGITMLLSFAIYFMASKGAVEMKFAPKAGMLKTTTTFIDNKQVIETLSADITGTLPKDIAAHSYNAKLLTSLLAFSVISIPLVLVQLTLGSHKNDVVSLTVNVISGIVFLVMFGLMAAALAELTSLNSEMKSSAKAYAALKADVLKAKNATVKVANDDFQSKADAVIKAAAAKSTKAKIVKPIFDPAWQIIKFAWK